MKSIIYLLLICLSATAYAQNTLSGKITDAANGSALPGAVVYIPDLKAAAQSGADGSYTLTNLPKGTYIVEVHLLGYVIKPPAIKIEGSVTQNFTLTASDYEEDEVVVTGNSLATDRTKTPYSITDVDHDYLNEHSATNVVDAVATIPGVSAMTDGQSISKPVIRGLGYNRVLTVDDGVEQMDQAWFDEFGIEIDPDAVDRAEILKGPASLAYGSDAISGVINFIPEQALPEGQMKGDVLFNYQTNNGLINNMVHLAGNNGGIAWSGRIDNIMAHAYSDPYDGSVTNSQFSNFNADGTVGIHRKWGYSQVHVSYFDMATGIVDGTRDSATGRMERQLSYPGVTPPKSASDTAPNPGDPFYVIPSNQENNSYTPFVINQRIRHTKVVWDNSLAVGDGRITGIFSYQQNQRQETNDPTMPNTPDIYYLSNAYTYDVRYITPQTGGFNMSVGSNGASQVSQSLGTLQLIPNYTIFQAGGFAIANEQIGKLSLSGGIRYDNRKFTGQSTWIDSTTQEPVAPNAVNSFHEFEAFTTNFSGVSGSFGGAYNFTDAVYLKANIARGFRAPNVAEAAANGVHDGTVVYELGNASLKPETSLEEDVAFGIKTKDVNFEADGFVNTIDDFIYAQSLQSAIPNNGDSMNYSLAQVFGGVPAPVFKYEQTAAQLYGGEISLDIHPATIHGVDLLATMSMVNGGLQNVPDSIKYLPFVPPMRITADLKFHIKGGKGIKNPYIKVGMLNASQQSNIYQQSAVYTGLTTASTPYEYAASRAATAGYTVFNAGAGGKIMSNGKEFCELYIVCNNLFDLAYMDYMSRFKYYPVNYSTDRVGVFNMGRNISFKVIIPFDFSKK